MQSRIFLVITIATMISLAVVPSFTQNAFAGIYSISGLPYNDNNMNGIRDSTEPIRTGVLMTITGTFVNGTSYGPVTTTSNFQGYTFANLDPGSFTITSPEITGWGHTTPAQLPATIDAASVTGINFGYIRVSTITGRPFNDVNGNGVLDTGEPSVAGFTLVLSGTRLDGINITPITLTSNPTARFTNIFPGTYTLTISPRTGFGFTTPTSIENIVVPVNGANLAYNFGAYVLGAVQGNVYQDINGNGVRNNGENTVAGITVVLEKSDNTLSLTRLTNAQGGFSFGGLTPGSYFLTASILYPYVVTEPMNYPLPVTITYTGTRVTQRIGYFDSSDLLVGFGDITSIALEGMAIDTQGYIYSADLAFDTINKFDKDGNQEIYTMSVDGTVQTNISNNVADDTDPRWSPDGTQIAFIRIRGVNLIASIGSGVLNNPSGIAVDSNGNIFVSDGSHRVFKFSSGGTLLLTVGSRGNANNQFDLPRGLAVDAQNNLYVADGNNNRIQKFDNNVNYLSTPISGGILPGQVRLPFDITIDSLGRLIIADSGNDRIQVFDSNGQFLAAFGTRGGGDGQFIRPRSATVAADGSFYVADTYNNRIQVFSNSYTFVKSFGNVGADPGEFGNPSKLIKEAGGTLRVVDTSNDRIQSFDSNDQFLMSFKTRPSPSEIYFSYLDSTGKLYVSDGHNHRIKVFDATTGVKLSQFGELGNLPGEFRGPRGIALAQDGSIFVADNYNNRVSKLDANGNFILSFGGSGNLNGQFNQPRGVVVESTGNVLVADTQNNRIQRFAQDGTFINSIAVFQPYQIALDSAGNIYAAEQTANVVQKFSSNGNLLLNIGTSGSGPGQVNTPRGVYVDASGFIYVVDQGNQRVQKFDASGTYVSSFGSFGVGPLQFNAPRTLIVDSAGDLWICDTGNFRVQQISPTFSFIKEIMDIE